MEPLMKRLVVSGFTVNIQLSNSTNPPKVLLILAGYQQVGSRKQNKAAALQSALVVPIL